MKKVLKNLMLCLLLLTTVLSLAACGCEKGEEVPYGSVTRDALNIGGETLTFAYDDENRVATFGATGEEIAYYADEEVNGLPAGNRVGIKLTAPAAITEFEGIKLTIGTNEWTEDVLDGDNYILIYPLVSAEMKTVTVKVKWNNNTKEQVYTIKIANGTTFQAPPAA